MKILVTNDDGINAKGLEILVEKVKKYGEITIVAPKNEKSATSHAITVRDSFEFGESKKFGDIKAYYIDSTPADCVRYAQYGLKLDFDYVFSGINKGYNLGEDILYSGTIGAVFEGANQFKKGIAFSTQKNSFQGAAKYFDEVMEFIKNNNLLSIGQIYNINFPECAKGILITEQGGKNFTTYFENQENQLFQLGDFISEIDDNKNHLDNFCIANGYISITPLTVLRTDYEVYNKIRNIIKK